MFAKTCKLYQLNCQHAKVVKLMLLALASVFILSLVLFAMNISPISVQINWAIDP